MWQFNGKTRPPFAEAPGPDQESVWDYPRPPAISADSRHVIVKNQDVIIADSIHAVRILETASPPTYYVPPQDVNSEYIVAAAGSSFCEWKGEAHYFSLDSPQAKISQVGWFYPEPNPDFARIAGYFSFYPAKIECYVDTELVRAQPGGFYGGWVTDDIVGPIKGLRGTSHW
jgi:uncharacterized protein (DUF427 family)